MKNTIIASFAAIATLFAAGSAHAQYVGVTCGWNYSNDLNGPNTGMANTPLFNPIPGSPNLTWDEWADELGAAQVDYVCPNLRGSFPEIGLSPVNIAPLITALNNKGLGNRVKLAIFDDNASSWTAMLHSDSIASEDRCTGLRLSSRSCLALMTASSRCFAMGYSPQLQHGDAAAQGP